MAADHRHRDGVLPRLVPRRGPGRLLVRIFNIPKDDERPHAGLRRGAGAPSHPARRGQRASVRGDPRHNRRLVPPRNPAEPELDGHGWRWPLGRTGAVHFYREDPGPVSHPRFRLDDHRLPRDFARRAVMDGQQGPGHGRHHTSGHGAGERQPVLPKRGEESPVLQSEALGDERGADEQLHIV